MLRLHIKFIVCYTESIKFYMVEIEIPLHITHTWFSIFSLADLTFQIVLVRKKIIVLENENIKFFRGKI